MQKPKNISSFLQHVRELPNRIIQETDERDAWFDVVTLSLTATRVTFLFSATSSMLCSQTYASSAAMFIIMATFSSGRRRLFVDISLPTQRPRVNTIDGRHAATSNIKHTQPNERTHGARAGISHR